MRHFLLIIKNCQSINRSSSNDCEFLESPNSKNQNSKRDIFFKYLDTRNPPLTSAATYLRGLRRPSTARFDRERASMASNGLGGRPRKVLNYCSDGSRLHANFNPLALKLRPCIGDTAKDIRNLFF